MPTEFRYAALTTVDAGSATFQGVLMKYNSVGEGPFGKEVFLPGSFGDLSQSSILLNIQHDRSRPIARTPDTMTLSDSNSALVLVAKPPPTREVQDAKLLVAAGILQGLSIEFNCKQQEMRDGIRVVSRAELVGVAICDKPAFSESTVEARRAEARAMLGLRIRGIIPYGQISDCRCQSGNCNKVKILKDSFKDSLSEDREILAQLGDYSKPLGSRKRGSLILTDTPAGLVVDSALPDSTAGRDLIAEASTVPILMRPFFNQSESTFVEEGDVAVYSAMKLRSILVGPTDAAEGWPEAELVTPQEARRADRWEGRRRVCL